jgi:phage gp29-like protein
MPDPTAPVPRIPLVWPNGQLMQREQLPREVAAPRMSSVRSILSGHPAAGIDPRRLASILRAAENGDATAYLELAEEMEEKDMHYLSVLGTRKRAVAKQPIEVIAASDAPHHKQHAELLRKWLKRDMLYFEIMDILDAIGKGYSVTEMLWLTKPGEWLPDDLKWRDPRWFEFDRVNGETLKLRTSGEPEPLAAAKYIIHIQKAKSGLPIRGGLARIAAWGWMFKNFAIKDWVSFLETYGMPMRLGRYDNGETEENIAILARAVGDLGSDAAAVFPKSMEITFEQANAGSAPGDLWRAKAEFVNDEMSKAVLGQTNTTDAKAGGLGSGQANVHNEVRGDVCDADCMLLAATLTRDVAKPIVMLNFGQQDEYPRFKVGAADPVDVEGVTKAAAALVPLGVEISKRKIREMTNMPEPEGPEDVLTAPSSPNPDNLPSGAPTGPLPGLPQRPRSTPALLAPLKPPVRRVGVATADPNGGVREIGRDAIDESADAFLDDWVELVEPVLSPIEQLVAASTSLEQVRDGLTGLIGRMDESELAGMLAMAGFASRLAGDADQQRDEREAG